MKKDDAINQAVIAFRLYRKNPANNNSCLDDRSVDEIMSFAAKHIILKKKYNIPLLKKK